MDEKPTDVLLVEDSAGDARLLQEMLADVSFHKHQITLVGRLDSALRCLEEAHFDLVVLDLGLPDEQGFGTFARVHQRAPQIPIIVLTGLEDEPLGLKTVQEGAQDYLIKGRCDGNLLARAMRYAVERKATAEKLRRSEERLRTYINGANDLIFTLDPAGRITSANQMLYATIGYREEELLGRNALELIAPESYAVTAEALAKVLNQESVEQVTLEAVTKGGHRLTLEVRGLLLYEDGEFAGTFHIARDITERKQAEEERERLILELQDALGKVKTLSGLLPICASCKRIRDDAGYWTQVEVYIRDHADVEFSHGICPDCMKKLYPDFCRE